MNERPPALKTTDIRYEASNPKYKELAMDNFL